MGVPPRSELHTIPIASQAKHLCQHFIEHLTKWFGTPFCTVKSQAMGPPSQFSALAHPQRAAMVLLLHSLPHQVSKASTQTKPHLLA